MKESSCCPTNLPPDITMYKNLKIVSNGHKKGIYDTCSGKMLLNYIIALILIMQTSINLLYLEKIQNLLYAMYRIWKDYKFIFTDFALQGNRYKTHHEKVSDIVV